jgi:PTH1 family peptidyl-tRNA hydrolase
MKLVVGLGNPGREYVGTRHNVGFDVVDVLANRLGWVNGDEGFNRNAREKFGGLALDGNCKLPSGETEKLLLLKPLTFMNLSGKAVQAAMAFYQLMPADIMVVLDDVALPCGKIRLRSGGSDGGHNGLKDIQRALGTNQYPRLRLGIDAPPQFVPQRDYVLGRFTEPQRLAMKTAGDRAASAILCWTETGIESAMNRFNADPADKAKPSDK